MQERVITASITVSNVTAAVAQLQVFCETAIMMILAQHHVI